MKAFKYSAAALAVLFVTGVSAESYRVVVKPSSALSVTASQNKAMTQMNVNGGDISILNMKPLFNTIYTMDVEASSGEEAVALLKRTGAFEHVELDIRIQASVDAPQRISEAAGEGEFPDDPYFMDQLSYFGVPGESHAGVTHFYGHSLLPLLEDAQDAEPVRIGIIDGGFARVEDINWGDQHLDFIDNDADPFLDIDAFPPCENSHGVGVAGTAAAIVNNGLNTAGSSGNAQVFAARALECGGGYLSDAAYAIAALSGVQASFFEDEDENNVPALPEPVDVINMSFTALLDNTIACPFYLVDAIKIGNENGVMLFSSAGNNSAKLGSGEGEYTAMPAMCGDVVNVAATGVTDDLADFSNFGDVDLAFRGDGIVAPAVFDDGAGVGYWEGTSFSSPLIAGAAGLLKQSFSDLTYGEFMQAVKMSAEPYSADSECVGKGDVCGDGFINMQSVYSAIEYIRGEVTATPVFDGKATCDVEFLDKHLGLSYPICEHYVLSIGEFALKNKSEVAIYRVEAGAPIDSQSVGDNTVATFVDGDPLFFQAQPAIYDYFYRSCPAGSQCEGDLAKIDVAPQAGICR